MRRLTRATALALLLASLGLVVTLRGQDYYGRGPGAGGGPSISTPNTWTALQTFSGGASIAGASATTINGIATVSTDGLVIQNQTAATAGQAQQSPRLRLSGFGWGTTAGASQPADCLLETVPTAGSVVGVVTYYKCALNGGAYAELYRATATATGIPSVTVVGNVLAGGGGSALASYYMAGVLVIGNGTPGLSSGFGTSPALVSGKWYSFRWNVGTGGSASTGVIATNATAAATGWNCAVNDLLNAATTRTVQTASTTTTASFASFSSTTGASTPWVAGAVLAIACTGF